MEDKGVKRFMFFVDYDTLDFQFVQREVEKLAELYPELGNIAVVLRSDNGFHVIFTKTRLKSLNEALNILTYSALCHPEYKHFSNKLQDMILRRTRKPDQPSWRPHYVISYINGKWIKEDLHPYNYYITKKEY